MEPMGTRSPNKARFTAWLPEALAEPMAVWMCQHECQNRTAFVIEALVEKLQGHGVELPKEVLNAVGAGSLLRARKMAVTAHSGAGKTQLAVKEAKPNFSRSWTRGGRIIFGAWVDHRLVAGIELLLKSRPQMNRSGFLTEAVVEKLRKDEVLTKEKALEFVQIRKPLRPEAYEGVRLRETRRDPKSNDLSNRQAHRKTLLKLIKSLPSAGFEKLCARILQKCEFEKIMVPLEHPEWDITGTAVQRINPSTVLKVFIQCKAWGETTSPSQIHDFRDAIRGNAQKGMIIAASGFNNSARKEAQKRNLPPVELLSGEDLMGIFESKEFGVTVHKTYEADAKFFDEFRK